MENLTHPDFNLIAGAREITAAVALEVLNGRIVYEKHVNKEWVAYYLIDNRTPLGDISHYSILVTHFGGGYYRFNASGTYEADYKFNKAVEIIKKMR